MLRYHVVLEEKLLKNNLHNGMHRETMLGVSFFVGFFLRDDQVRSFHLPPGRRGAWAAQSVKRPTLGFGSGHDLMGFVGSGPASGSALAAWSLLGILSPSLSAPPLLPLSLSLSK